MFVSRLAAARRAVTRTYFLLLVAFLLAAGLQPAAADDGCALADGVRSTITGIVDGDTVVLADGREVRFTGIQAPKLPLGRKGFAAWPLSTEAKAALSRLALGKQVLLRHGGAEGDRHGRILAQLYVPDAATGKEIWLQEEMLKLGLARVYTFRDNRACAARLLDAEREARAGRHGIWANSFYAIRDAADVAALEKLEGTFQLVAGQVATAQIVRGRLYINFGEDWRQDFTVTASAGDAKLFLEDSVWGPLLEKDAVSGLAGRSVRVRVRGWLGRYNGPEITVTHPEQIELLAE
jgi:micrococcal nuclease